MSVFGIRLAGLLLLWMAVASIASRPMVKDDLMKQDDLKMKKGTDELEEQLRPMEHASLLKHVSAIPPFVNVKIDKHFEGHKPIRETFALANGALTSNSFIRLVMDGYNAEEHTTVVSKSTIESSSDEFSAVIKFRLSGTSVNHGVIFGWTFNTRYIENPINDIEDLYLENKNLDTMHLLFSTTTEPPPFEGFAVVMDTSKNRNGMKDVFLVYNDGTMSTELMHRTATGCDGNLHYLEKKNDARIATASQLRLVYSKGLVALDIDTNNSGKWTQCSTLQMTHLKNGFTKHAHIGVTGVHRKNEGTSNLDLMEMRVFDTSVPPETIHKSSKIVENDPYISLMNNMEYDAFRIYAGFRKSVSNMVELADKNRHLMDQTEHVFKGDVLSELKTRISKVEKKLYQKIDHTLTEQVADVERYLMQSIEDSLHELYSSAGYYIFPLIGITIVFVAVYVFSYVKYRELKKAHLC